MKLLAIAVSVLLALELAGCGKSSSAKKQATEQREDAGNKPSTSSWLPTKENTIDAVKKKLDEANALEEEQRATIDEAGN